MSTHPSAPPRRCPGPHRLLPPPPAASAVVASRASASACASRSCLLRLPSSARDRRRRAACAALPPLSTVNADSASPSGEAAATAAAAAAALEHAAAGEPPHAAALLPGSQQHQGSTLRLVLTDRTLQVVLLNLVLYAVYYNLSAPVLPALISSFGGGSGGESPAATMGRLQSWYAALQLVGGLACGPLFDARGAKFGLVLSFLTGSLSYALTAAATGLPLLLLSRVPAALQHAMLAARVAVTARAVGPAQSAALLAYCGLAYSVGSIAGPVLGGALAGAFSLRATSVVAAAGSLLSAVLVLAFLPADRPAAAAAAAAAAPAAAPASNCVAPPRPPPPPPPPARRKPSPGDLLRVASCPGVPALLSVKLAMGFSLSLLFGVFSVASLTTFGMTPRTTGALLSWMSVVTMLTQAFVLERAVRAVPPGALLRACLAAMALSLAGVGTAGGVAALSAWLVPLNVACVVAFTANSVALNGAAPPEDRGTLSALDMGTASAVRVVCPLLGAWLLGRCGFGGVAAASAAIMLALLIATSLGVGGNPGALAAKRAAAAAG